MAVRDGVGAWLSNYYGKLIGESQFSRSRRDAVINWGLTLFLAVLAAYGASLTSQIVLPRFWKVSLLATALGLLVRFFVQGMIAYSFLLKWRHLAELIESYWGSGTPSVQEIFVEIEKYDHGRRTPIRKRKMIWSQLRAGSLLMFLALTAILLYELGVAGPLTLDLWIPIAGLVIYLGWETATFVTYDQLKMPERKKA